MTQASKIAFIHLFTQDFVFLLEIVNYLKNLFEKVNVKVEISMEKGQITTSEYKDNVKEAISQVTIKVEKEELE